MRRPPGPAFAIAGPDRELGVRRVARVAIDHGTGIVNAVRYVAGGAARGAEEARSTAAGRGRADGMKADSEAVATAISMLVAGWGFLHGGYALQGVRELVRISVYHLERVRLAIAARCGALIRSVFSSPTIAGVHQ